MPAPARHRPASRRTTASLAGFAFVAVALWAAGSLLSLWPAHLLGNAATICASGNWQPWTSGGPATTGFSLAPLGLVCTYPHFADGSPIRVYPDEPGASLFALCLVLAVLGAWFLLGGHYRIRPVTTSRACTL
ncbi:hypothetical protein [Subtercola sp. YIM 133946]|uniref:hypothetical protein n=1 Tax=Subtercola sp. YIM 133946 TaxID=3118909 RepID=UPI002F93B02D